MGQECVKELRNQKGWSQSELATVSGLSVKTIQRVERGQGAPSLDTAKALASVFHRPFSDFIPSPSATATSAQQHRDNAASAETTSSQVSADVPANLLHSGEPFWRVGVITLLLVASVGFLAKLYLNVETLSADVSEIAAMRDIELASDSLEGSTSFASNLEREVGVFSDYYGNYVTVALQSNEWDERSDRDVSLLENRMLRDIARIVSAWEAYMGANFDVGSHIILRNNLQCYRDERTPSDSVSESIVKMNDCIYVVLSDANWQVDHEVEQAFKNLAQAMEETTPFYRALHLNSSQITQQ